MESSDELIRPPAAVSAMLMVSPRDLRREVTSSKIGRMALGGKSETDDVDMVRCWCCRSPIRVLCVVGARTAIFLFKKRDVGTVIWYFADDVRTQRDGNEEGIQDDCYRTPAFLPST